LRIGIHTARVLALAAWALFSTALWLTGGADRFLAERTTWVVPFGAFVTGAAAVLLLARGRRAAGRPLSARDGASLAVLLAPIAAVLAVPHAELGAAAAERRAARGPSAPVVVPEVDPVSGYSYAHILATRVHPQPGVEAGVPVRLIGFVMRKNGTPDGMFQVTRFQINCCVADATPLFVTVRPRGPVPPRDAWVEVKGRLEPGGGAVEGEGRFIVGDAEVTRIAPPEQPYLMPGGLEVAPVLHGTRPPDPTKP
jgi:uncharacterized repeat protein (TIGR03943 family)